MVRLVLFFFALILLPIILKAQVSVTVDPLSFVLTGNPNETDIYYYVHVTNTGNEPTNIYWSKRMTNEPAPWTSWICDKTLCWDSIVNTCPANKPNILAPGESMDLQVHLNPYQREGTGDYELKVLDADFNTIATVNGAITVSTTTAVKEAGDSKLTVFPNPTSDFFEVSETPGLRYVEVFNIIGNKVRSYDAGPRKQYYVGDLADGIYLVRLATSSKKVLKTIRLSKR